MPNRCRAEASQLIPCRVRRGDLAIAHPACSSPWLPLATRRVRLRCRPPCHRYASIALTVRRQTHAVSPCRACDQTGHPCQDRPAPCLRDPQWSSHMPLSRPWLNRDTSCSGSREMAILKRPLESPCRQQRIRLRVLESHRRHLSGQSACAVAGDEPLRANHQTGLQHTPVTATERFLPRLHARHQKTYVQEHNCQDRLYRHAGSPGHRRSGAAGGLEHSPACLEHQAGGQVYTTGSPTQLADLPVLGPLSPSASPGNNP